MLRKVIEVSGPPVSDITLADLQVDMGDGSHILSTGSGIDFV